MKQPIEMPHLMEIFRDGYSEDMVKTLLDSIEAYGAYMAKCGTVAADADCENIYNLVWLVRAILNDTQHMNL